MEKRHKKEYFEVIYTSWKKRYANRDPLMYIEKCILEGPYLITYDIGHWTDNFWFSLRFCFFFIENCLSASILADSISNFFLTLELLWVIVHVKEDCCDLFDSRSDDRILVNQIDSDSQVLAYNVYMWLAHS